MCPTKSVNDSIQARIGIIVEPNELSLHELQSTFNKMRTSYTTDKLKKRDKEESEYMELLLIVLV